MTPAVLSWTIAGVATAGVVTRPFKLPEATWAVAGAALIVALGLLPASLAWQAVAKGNDVYLFLTGMMLLSETGRRAGVFDWLAVLAVNHAQGSPRRLFLLVYLIGIVITTFMSNDAAAVVLTPAVFAVAKKARAPALPLLFICAFIANAASFVLPISNPANLVLYGKHTPPLREWLAHFALPSLMSILATYAMLRWTQRRHLDGHCASRLDPAPLSAGGRLAVAGMVVTALALLGVSALDMDLGLPTAALGALTAAAVLVRERSSPWPVVNSISWGVLLLVAGLFILVETLDHTGVIRTLTEYLVRWTRHDATTAGALAGAIAGFGGNAINNLPAGLIASSALMQAHSPASVVDALVIGIDLGPNLSITGSLATILWLSEIRREGEEVSFLQFLKAGALVMPPALALALGVRLLLG
jgi:arsenical pump membrane protein